MKTLKQILEPLYSLTKGDKLLCIVSVREWLQQKQKEIALKIRDFKNKFPMKELIDKTPLELDLLLQEQDVYLKLLEELK